MSRFKSLGTGLGAVALATLVSAAAASAVASSPITTTLVASKGSSATPARHGTAFKLHVAGNPATAFAVVKLHGFPTKAPSTAPSFKATFFQSGTPRWYIKFANGDYLFGYPPLAKWDAHKKGGGTLPGGNYVTYSQALAAVQTDAGGTLPNVRKVAIIADGSAPVPYTTVVSHVVYAGQPVTP